MRPIDKLIADLADWCGKMLANLRKVIQDADPEIFEEWKWMVVTFAQGASLSDPDKLFNAGRCSRDSA